MKKKILLPIIIAVVAVALIAIAAITIYTGKYGKNAPILEVKEEVTVMEYSTVHIDEFIINTENISSVRIADIKLQGRNDPGHAKISDDGQSVSIGDFWEFYTVTIEAKGTNGWKVREEVGLYSYGEPPVYVSEESSDEVLEDEINTEAVSEERVSEEASETEANKDGASEELENSEGLSEEERFLAELEKIEGDYTYEEAKALGWGNYFLADKDFLTLEHLYFKDKRSFLTAYGFDVDEPFYKVYAEGDLVLTMYYDEETELGCVISGSRGLEGACFQGATTAEWNGYLWGDYTDPVVVHLDERLRPQDYMEDYHYDEIKEYDDAGRLVEYRVTNIDDYIKEECSSAKDSYDGWNDALKVTYEYQPNGELAYREYVHNSYIFGTTQSVLQTWFDEQGRPVYECAYITHGALEWFYIYEDEDEIPEYILSTDFGWGPAELTQYK
ncbi:MAG: hypothetical protein J6C06_03395 [Lachnospiraceae bacterium]|nr:hypothetical protein [Lachnospiraceae bacterium]